MWRCRCDCGNEVVVRAVNLKPGHTSSCGCVQIANRIKHCASGTALHQIWNQMRDRCRNKNNANYKNYGGRGISVCSRWDSFALFAQDVGQRPSPNHSIDRYPNPDGNYEPGNVRWATQKQQVRNSRRSRTITFDGITMLSCEWDDILGLRPGRLADYISQGRTVSGHLSRAVSLIKQRAAEC
jgi:hypothetical protein